VTNASAYRPAIGPRKSLTSLKFDVTFCTFIYGCERRGFRAKRSDKLRFWIRINVWVRVSCRVVYRADSQPPKLCSPAAATDGDGTVIAAVKRRSHRTNGNELLCTDLTPAPLVRVTAIPPKC